MDKLRKADERAVVWCGKKLLAVIGHCFDTDGGGTDSELCKACKLWRESDEDDSGVPCADEGTEEDDKLCRDSGYTSTCIRPVPELLPAIQNLWSLWERTAGGGFTRFVSGMEIIPVGKIRADVVSEAEAMGIPWDDLTSRWYGMIENAWLADLAWKRKRAKGA